MKTMAPARSPVFELRGLCKARGGARVLDDIDLRVDAHEVHALIGEAGEPRAALLQLLAGGAQPDAGQILVDGTAVQLRSPLDSLRHGIHQVPQEIGVAPNLSVAENIHFGRGVAQGGLVRWARLHESAAEVLERIEAPVSPRALAGALRPAQQQLVVIARALASGAKVLVLDDPTSRLDARDSETLLGVICRLARDGMAIVHMSHRVGEIYALADRVSVLRGGRIAGRLEGEAISTEQVLQLLSRGARAPLREARRQASPSVPLLEARDLADGERVEPASLRIARGEVLGLTGLLGSGRTRLCRLLVGAAPARAGGIWVEGCAQSFRSPADALREGIVYLAGDAQDGATLFAHREPEARRRTLAWARALVAQPKVVILDEPVQGLEPEAAGEVEAFARGLAATGTSVLWVSSDMASVVRVCDRALVMYEGAVCAEIDPARGDPLDERALLGYATGAPAAAFREPPARLAPPQAG